MNTLNAFAHAALICFRWLGKGLWILLTVALVIAWGILQEVARQR
jgi:nitrate reductase NapE component